MSDTVASERIKITYATLRADDERLHQAFERGVEHARARLGRDHANVIAGRERSGERMFELRSPIDSEILVGRFASASRQDVRDAIAAARAAQPGWAALGWDARIARLRQAAELISERQMEYAALMAIEVGKNRMEALGEVEESADLIRYYADTAEREAFFERPLDSLGDPSTRTRSGRESRRASRAWKSWRRVGKVWLQIGLASQSENSRSRARWPSSGTWSGRVMLTGATPSSTTERTWSRCCRR